MPQTTQTITDTTFVEMRTTEAGDKYLVLEVTYSGGGQELKRPGSGDCSFP